MGLFGLVKTSTSRGTVLGDIAARYKRFRPTRLRLNDEIVSRLSCGAIQEGAKKLGIFHRGTLVFDSEDELSVLMDYCIYNVYRNGRNAVDDYLCDCPPDPEPDEMECLRAMQHARFALVHVLRTEPRVGCHIRNMYTEETRLMADIGLSKTAKRGVVMATRLLDFGDFVASSGASLPLGILEDADLEEWQREIRATVDDQSDPAPLIRACLESGAASHVRYEGVDTGRRLDVTEVYRPAKTSSQQRRKSEKRRIGKAPTNRRCRCGSGKMLKNCCGKH